MRSNGDTLYAFVMAWPGEQAIITSLRTGRTPIGKVQRVELLGSRGNLPFTQDADGLKVKFPARRSGADSAKR